MKHIGTICALFFGLGACSSLPYNDDIGFLVSAQANAPEFPIFLNGALCKDADGNPGLCSKRIKTTDTLALHFDPQAYAYNLTIDCTNPMVVPGASVPAGQAFDLAITPAEIGGLKSFICEGFIFPQDRVNPPINAMFDVRVLVEDSAYVPREAITSTVQDGNTYLVLGEYARNAWVYDGQKWSQHSKDTMVQVKSLVGVQAYSESYSDRFNFYNYTGPVSQ